MYSEHDHDFGFSSLANGVMQRVGISQAGSAAMVTSMERAETFLVRRGHYVLFNSKDVVAWLIFLGVFLLLIAFDNFVLHRQAKVISFTRACAYATFWLFCGVCWNVYVYFHRGWDDALLWSTGYLLEWMLSMDCLFFFHIIFKMFGTPNHLKHIPLFWGIVMAIFFRMFFFLLEEVMMHSFYLTHVIFGLFLIYTGIKSATMGDEHFDPRENALFVFATKYVRLINRYDDNGHLFIRCKVDKKTNETIDEPGMTTQTDDKFDKMGGKIEKPEQDDVEKVALHAQKQEGYGTQQSSQAVQGEYTYKWHGTLLVVVVFCITITDLIFAVDSVSAVVAEVPDLFLAYTASVFAVLNLRAMFFVTDQLIHMFVLLKYGIASILVIIGLKLLLKEWVVIPAYVMIMLLIGIVAICITGSLALVKYQEWRDSRERSWRERNTPERTSPPEPSVSANHL
jgi:tellurite resistance protein TerC